MFVLLATPPGPRHTPVLPALFTLSHPRVQVGFDLAAFLDPAPDSVALLDFRPDRQATADFVCRIRQVDIALPLIGVFRSDGVGTISPTWGLTDFIVDTISPPELQARLDRAALRTGRRVRETADVPLPDGRFLRLDGDARGLHVAGRFVALTAAEFEVFEVLASEPGRVFRRAELVSVGDSPRTPTVNAVTIVILRLRRKLGPQADLIRTVRGVGYQFAAPSERLPPPDLARPPVPERRTRSCRDELVV